jgi:hypothetical protein
VHRGEYRAGLPPVHIILRKKKQILRRFLLEKWMPRTNVNITGIFRWYKRNLQHCYTYSTFIVTDPGSEGRAVFFRTKAEKGRMWQIFLQSIIEEGAVCQVFLQFIVQYRFLQCVDGRGGCMAVCQVFYSECIEERVCSKVSYTGCIEEWGCVWMVLQYGKWTEEMVCSKVFYSVQYV